MTTTYVAAVDLGASSGVIMLGRYDQAHAELTLQETHRFTNQFQRQGTFDCWDIDTLITEIKTGIEKSITILKQEHKTLASISVDTWGVDYVLLNQHGDRIAPAIAYRDHRTDGIMTALRQKLGDAYIYEKTGIQFLSFNTLYQLKALAEEHPDYLEEVAYFQMIPDYICYALTGVMNTEYTNCTTTQMLNVHTDDWDQDLLNQIGIPASWFSKPTLPGNRIGFYESEAGLRIPVHACASHDTASAVLAAPLSTQNSAYLSSGTWSLMGIEHPQAITHHTALAHNLTNEGGYNKQYRILKNIMGLWILQNYCKEHEIADIRTLIHAAAQESPFCALINPNDPRFLNPDSMTRAIDSFCTEYDQPQAQNEAQYARIIFDSLALMYRHTLKELEKTSALKINRLNIVGGGSQNQLLNQLCADLCEIPVLAGPVEGSALGNIGSQLISLGLLSDPAEFRTLIQKNFALTEYLPRPVSSKSSLYNRFLTLLQ